MKRAAVFMTAAVLAGCGTEVPPGEPHQLLFEVSGTATVSTLTCTVDGKESTENNVGLPWRRVFEFPPGTGKHEYRVVLKYADGSVNATAKLDGKLQSSSAGAGDGPSTQSLTGDFSD
ncbi:hypothetical protein M8542_23170 [Amycolatopsis sp. OK19-0408]|uniref:Uncharacterized protein n=1 Tax=Amycolatopsis iheyensis TaxID=2945988 RepID=A0A9X2NBQ3_9PSEU|nr:hypothetical protein [Amycolatopsis iheyensis]MCR6485729.1 hypothetical protein [Amycolatopsis iheyensis]